MIINDATHRSAEYYSRCLDCGWTTDEQSPTPARMHARNTGHTSQCDVKRVYIYEGRLK